MGKNRKQQFERLSTRVLGSKIELYCILLNSFSIRVPVTIVCCRLILYDTDLIRVQVPSKVVFGRL